MEKGKIEGVSSLLWKTRLTVFTHPREGEEVDYIFGWRFEHERSVMSPEMKQRF